MTLHQLNIFRNLVMSQSYSATAEKLFLTQPSVSAQIKSLELSLGVQLIDREQSAKTKGIVLTEEGQAIYDSVLVILQEIKQITKYSWQSRVNKKKQISLLTNSPIASYLIPSLLSKYMEYDSQTKVKLTTKTLYSELKKFSKSDSFDLCIIPYFNEIPPENILYTFDIPIVLVMKAASGFGDKTLHLADSAASNVFDCVLLPTRNSASNAILKDFFEKEKVHIKSAMEIDHTDTAKKILSSTSNNYGAFLSIITVAEEIQAGAFHWIKTFPELPRVKYTVIRNPGRDASEQVDLFCNCLQASLSTIVGIHASGELSAGYQN